MRDATVFRYPPSFRPPRQAAKFFLITVSGSKLQRGALRAAQRIEGVRWAEPASAAKCRLTASLSSILPNPQIMGLSYAVIAPLTLPAAACFFVTGWVRATGTAAGGRRMRLPASAWACTLGATLAVAHPPPS